MLAAFGGARREATPCALPLEFDAATGMWQFVPEPVVRPKETAATEVARVLEELGGVATTSEIAAVLGCTAAVSRQPWPSS